MIYFHRITYTPLLILIFLGCRSQNYSQKKFTEDDMYQLAEQKLRSPIQYLPNKDSSYYACISSSSKDPREPFPLRHIIIVKKSSREVIFEDQQEGAELEWINLYQLKIWIPSRIADQSTEFLYDVRYKNIIRY